MDVAIQVAAFEEPGLAGTLDAWAAQPVPEWATVSYEAWVTPSGPKGACGTWQQAADHDTFTVREAPQYKLRARNAAHESALDRGIDAFVSCDADAPPLSDRTLSNLLDPLRSRGTVASVSNPVSPSNPIGIYSNLKAYAREFVFRSVHGQCHAVTTDAWRQAGPFADDIDHTTLHSVWMEEEYGFGNRLRDVGRVEYAYDAPVRNDIRRAECRWRRAAGKATGEFCDRAEGEKTFAPR